MNYAEFLLWVRGPAFQIALGIFVFGVILRLLEIFFLGKKAEYAEKRQNGVVGGFRTIFSRFIPWQDAFARSAYIVIAGYIFHIGFFIVLLFFAPHITLFQEVFGFGWPHLPNALIDFATVMSMLALIAILIRRLTDPVVRLLSNVEDYVVWTVTFLPLLTGFMTYHHLIDNYPLMLALHILSVELLLIVFPFTKLMHTFTLFIARFYTGMNAGHRGVEI